MMTIRYSTNWMGPVSTEWYKKRGLTKPVEHVLTEHSIRVKLGLGEVGDVVVSDEIIERWAGGRIDIYGTGRHYGDEMGLPIMHAEDYNRFSEWLHTFETDDVWSLNQIVEVYERDNPKIRWDKEFDDK